MSAARFGDGHWPLLVHSSAELGILIGCQCGERPVKRVKRASMQHTWQQAHRRRLGLQPVEYVFPAWEQGVFSTGGYVQVSGYKWENGGWVRS